MKRNITIKDGDKEIKGSVAIRDEEHLKACIKYPSQVWKNKKKYTRKEKHKKSYEED